MKRGFLLDAAGKAAAKKRKAEQLKASESKKTEDTPQSIIGNTARQADLPPEFCLPYGNLTDEEKALPEDYDKDRLPINIVSVEHGKVTNLSAGQVLLTTIPHPDDGGGCTKWIITKTNAKLELMKTKGYPMRPKHYRPDLYEVRNTSDMGAAMFAKHDIKRGELIFSERPLLIAPCMISGPRTIYRKYNMNQARQVMMFEFEKILEAAVNQMGEKEKALYMGLYNSHTADGTGPLLGIMRTNAFDASEVSDIPSHYAAVCNFGSRLNHSCIPSVDAKFRMSSFSFQFVAIRDIKAGEQLFISYCKLNRTKAERRTDLAPYGFSCSCPACINATPATDKLRKTFEHQVNLYTAWMRELGEGIEDVLAAAQFLEKEMLAEGLDSTTNFVSLLTSISATFVRLGRTAEMRKYQKRLESYQVIHELTSS